ncbi:hypothetical protein [Caproiciproducens sp.]
MSREELTDLVKEYFTQILDYKYYGASVSHDIRQLIDKTKGENN